MQPRVLILHVPGANRDLDLATAFERAGATPIIVPLSCLRHQNALWQDCQLLALPGGFAYADILGAGKLLALELRFHFQEMLHHFVDLGKPVIGVCNGFQTLVQAGVLPAITQAPSTPEASLTTNVSQQFECRWVRLRPESRHCLWTQHLCEPVDCPAAHGEGRFLTASPKTAQQLQAQDQIAFRYIQGNGQLAEGCYPSNPNGSTLDIAGICNQQGNVLGLMPHPENHIFHWQHPRWTRGESGRMGLALFEQGVRYVSG